MPVHAAVQHIHVDGVVREDRQVGDEVAEDVARLNQRGWPQVLLMRGLQNVIRDVAGFGHFEVAMVHGLRNDHGHQAVSVGDFLGVPWLQGCHGREKVAPFIDKPEYVGNVARLELAVEPLLQLLVLVCLGPLPRQRLFYRVKLQVLELATAQFRIECPPLSIEFDKQGIKRLVNRLTQPRDVQRLEGFGLGLQGYQVIGKTPMLHTVVR